MSAQILHFMGVRKEAMPPAAPVFEKGDQVVIVDHDWDQGAVRVKAVVVSHRGEWVSVRVPDVGAFSVHQSKLEHADAPEAA